MIPVALSRRFESDEIEDIEAENFKSIKLESAAFQAKTLSPVTR